MVGGKNIFQLFSVLSQNQLSSEKLVQFTLQLAVVTARMFTMSFVLNLDSIK